MKPTPPNTPQAASWSAPALWRFRNVGAGGLADRGGASVRANNSGGPEYSTTLHDIRHDAAGQTPASWSAPALWRFRNVGAGDLADRGGASVHAENSGGPEYSTTLHDIRHDAAGQTPASWSAPALWRCGVAATCALFLVTSLAAVDVPAPAAPRRGGTLRVARLTDPQSIDPAVSYIMEELLLTRLVFQGLVDFDENLKVVPKQAIDWNISADRKTYTFHLRPGVRFANGREVGAPDYVYSLQRILNLQTQSPGESFFNGIVGTREFQQGKTPAVNGLRARDPYTLEIELDAPDFAFEFKMAMTFACAVPREGIEAHGDKFWLHAFGTGPYQLSGWTRGMQMTFERSREVNQGDEGYFDRVDVMIGGDRALHTTMFERDELDAVYLVQVPDVVRLTKDPRSREEVHPIDAASTDFLFLNTELPPFDNLKVRQAMNHAIDRRRLVTLTAHTAVAARGILPPVLPGFNPEQKGLEFDPEKARRLLQESGVHEGLRFDLWYSDNDPRWERIVLAIESDLHAVGITASLKKVAFPVLFTAMQTRRTVPCAYSGWSQDYPDPSNFLDVLFNGTRIQDLGGNNYSYYSNPEVNRLLMEADRKAVPPERYHAYQEIEQLILNDAPVVPLVHPAVPVLISKRIGGFRPHPVWQMQLEHWWATDSPKK